MKLDAQTKLAEYALGAANMRAGEIIDEIYNDERWDALAWKWAKEQVPEPSYKKPLIGTLIFLGLVSIFLAIFVKEDPFWTLPLIWGAGMPILFSVHGEEKWHSLQKVKINDLQYQVQNEEPYYDEEDLEDMDDLFQDLQTLIEQTVTDSEAKLQLLKQVKDHHQSLDKIGPDLDFYAEADKLKKSIHDALYAHAQQTLQVTT